MLKIPRTRYFNYPKFVRTAGFLFALLAFFAVFSADKKNIDRINMLRFRRTTRLAGLFLLVVSLAAICFGIIGTNTRVYSEEAIQFFGLEPSAYSETMKVDDDSGVKIEEQGFPTNPTCSIAFNPPGNYSVGLSPIAVAVADFNNDGKLDVVSANRDSNNVTILLGNGNGGFNLLTSFNVGTKPHFVSTADFNNDGKQDVVSANRDSNNVSVLLGNGMGGLSGPTNFDVGTAPLSVAAGDVNNDGNQDIAAANSSSSSVSVLLGTGTGGFANATSFGVGTSPQSVALADFNNDGKRDLVTANRDSNSVSLLLGNGLGSFGMATNLGTGGLPQSVAAANMNSDSNLDIITADYATFGISLLLLNGNGGVVGGGTYNTGGGPQSVSVGDFNGDGRPDILAANRVAPTSVSVFFFNEAGTPISSVYTNVPSGPTFAVSGDFNGDGKRDIVTANQLSNNVSILTQGCAPVVYSITGQISTAGNGLSGVNVALIGTSSANAVTDANGNYSFFNLPSGGNFVITPTKVGYQFTPESRTVTNLQSHQTANFSATTNHTISGQITFNGSVLSGANVVLSGGVSNSTTTDANGNYSFAALPSGGNYTITPSLAGYTFDPVTRSFTNIQANQLANFAATQQVVYSINGQITYNGNGLSGATIALSGTSSSSTTTDSNGNYSLANLPSGGAFTVTPSKLGYTFVPSNRIFSNLSNNQTGNFTASVPVAGGLDTTYNAGVQNPNFLGLLGDGRVRAIAIQPDGKHIIAGNFTTANSTGRSNIARFYPDGTLDESFDPGVGFPGGFAVDIVLQPDGKIIVGGNLTSFTNAAGTFSKYGIVRLNGDGSLDNSFNPGQGVRSAATSSGTIKTVVRQPDGKILIGGQFTTVDGVARSNIARLNEDGSLDQSFAVGTGAAGIVEAIALQSDGKVVIGGELTAYNGTVVNRLIRVDGSGVLDPAFNIGTGPNTGVITALKIQTDGKILVGGGFVQFNGQPGKWIVRLNTNGSRDSFLEGTVCNSLCTLTNPPQQFSVLANGQIYVSMQGTVNANSTAWGGTLLRYNADGARDTSFNPPFQTGATPLPLNNRHAVQADGSIIGTHGRYLMFPLIDGGPFSNVRRLSSTGAVDTNYKPTLGDIGGLSASGSFVADVALQADGKLLVGGNFSIANNAIRYDVARFNTNGSLDETFNYTFTGQTIFKILPLPDGKIIVCGAVSVGASNRLGIARLNSNGTLDTTFVGTGASGGNVGVFGAALQTDGKIIIVGRFTAYGGVARSGIARLHPDGAIDESFNPGTGLTVPGGGQEPYDVQVLPDGKIVVIGYFTAYNGTARPGLVRIQSNGVIDTNFAPSGQDFASYRALAQLPNGQLLAGGGALRRINTNGSIDQSFAGVPAFNVGAITDIRVLGSGNILIGGTFETQNGPRRSGVARILPNGGIDPSFGANLRGADTATPGVGGIEVDEANNHIYTGGNFHSYNNVGRGSIARLFLNSVVTTAAVTVNTNPAGRSFTVDGTTYTGPQTFNWESGSQHTIATTSPQAGSAGTQYVWANWSDGGAISHTVSPAADTTYTANFTTQHQLTMNAGAGGTVSPASGFYNAGQSVQITATPNTGFTFASWTGTGSGSYSGTNNPASVTLNAPLTQTAAFNVQCSYSLNPTQTSVSAVGGTGSFSVTAPAGCAWAAASNAAWLTTSSANSGNGTVNYSVAANTAATARTATITVGGQIFTVNQAGTVAVTVNTNPAGRTFTVDGTTYSSPQTFNWEAGSQHTIATVSPQAGTAGTQYVWANWSDGGAISHTVSPNANTTYTANFTTQHQLTMNAGAGGTVSPASDFYNAGETVQITATPNGGFTFANWTGTGTGSYSGTNNPASVTMNAPVTQTAAFNVQCSYAINPTQTSVQAAGGPGSFNVTAPTGCAWTAASNAAWLTTSSANSGNGTVNFNVAQNTEAARSAAITVGGQIFTVNQAATVISRTPFDFDGDGKADVSVFRPSNGAWYLLQSTNGFTGALFGFSTDKIVPADYDGDGKTDIAVFRDGTWYLQRSSLGFTGIAFGAAGDIPVPADYDGDGKADPAVFRPSNGTWYMLQSQNGFTGVQFGQTGDKPVAADYDGDGKTDLAVFRAGVWYLLRSQLGFTGIAFGAAEDKPVPADFDGDGKTDLAVFRPSNGTWYMLQSTAGFTGIQFGISTDLPAPADYDGDGKADVTVLRDGIWYLNRSQAGFTGIQFGAAGDKPIPNAFIP